MTDDEMCPNCVTPWKCNGPHILNTNPNEHIEYIYQVYNDLEDVVRREGAGNVVHDLEHMYPDLFVQLWGAFLYRRLEKNKAKLPALLDKNAPEL